MAHRPHARKGMGDDAGPAAGRDLEHRFLAQRPRPFDLVKEQPEPGSDEHDAKKECGRDPADGPSRSVRLSR
ncbi:MAG: hypothetical protein Kow00104_15400 [Rhodothalassiaceae bacterium]